MHAGIFFGRGSFASPQALLREDPENLHKFSSACRDTTHAIPSGLSASAQYRRKYADEGPVTPVVLGSLLKELLTPAVEVGTYASQVLAQIAWLYTDSGQPAV